MSNRQTEVILGEPGVVTVPLTLRDGRRATLTLRRPASEHAADLAKLMADLGIREDTRLSGRTSP